jgi:DNA mismatch endonuclease, patch repair protein
VDNLTAEQRKKTMTRVKSKDTKPEMTIRRLVHAMGYRFRLHRSDLPGKPDLTFPKFRKVIFVHGCFWHGHSCKAGKNRPASNKSYWIPKLERNMQRDIENRKKLKELGWQSLVIWECQIKDIDKMQTVVRKFLGVK